MALQCVSDDRKTTRVVKRPQLPPDLDVMFVQGNIVRLRLRQQERVTKRGRPDGAAGAVILFYVGATLPECAHQWCFLCNTKKTLIDAELPTAIPGGTKVWLTAMWFNTRLEEGPAALPVSTHLCGW